MSASVIAHTLWTSAAPAMAYRLYADEWHLSHIVTTGIFAIYPVVVALTLISFGDISDHIGRRAAMLMGLGASLVGTLLFAMAPDVLWLFAARALMGVGVGLTAGPSTAAVVEFVAAGPAANSSWRAALIATVAQAAGFAGALLLGGALIAYAPWPTRLSFGVLAMLLARAELEGFAAVMEGVRNAAPRLAGRAIAGSHDYAQMPELVERSKRRVANFYSDMDARLAEVPFVAGEKFSAADITTLVTVDFATRAFNMPVLAENVALTRWYDAVAARPSTAA